ncbi:urokinase plasminogen activator surface receptor isoform X1 [Labrus bergylta]|uniref:urokinase plasminogen activator surface receptor isoform X1 n=1 Tax=Labrus bergylta TaxID=56723 RepID=UPI003313B913
MNLLVLVFGVMLLHEAYTLKCYECVPGFQGNCTDKMIECPIQGQQCGAVTIRYIAGILQTESNMKSCFSADQCIEGSVNYDGSRTVITSKCCTTDLCNTEFAPTAPSTSVPNGRKCFGCIGLKCTSTVNCQGTEDHCISASVEIGDTPVFSKGCASKQICTNHPKMIEHLGVDISCCQGDLCNSASTLRAGLQLLLLLVPLLTSVMLC